MQAELDDKDFQRLEILSGILLRCFCITVTALLFVWGVVFLFGDPIHRFHSMVVGMSSQQFDWFVLGSLTCIKVLNVVFFLFPFVAIRHYLRSHMTAK